MIDPMQVSLGIIAAISLVAIAGYVQYRIPAHTIPARVALTRGILALVGVAFGYTVAANYPGAGGLAPLVFLAAFGAVHLPAAIILALKDLQGAGRS